MTCNRLLKKFNCKYLLKHKTDNIIKTYIQSNVIKKTLESISVKYKQGLNEEESAIKDTTTLLQKFSLVIQL